MLTRRTLLAGASLASALASLPAFADETAKTDIVILQKGRIRGSLSTHARVFRGIPCGKDPYSPDRRFLPPQEVDPWEGILECISPADIPLQVARDKPVRMIGGSSALSVNVWTPLQAKQGTSLPVMVWIPGGGSMNCDNNDPRFNGEAFARDGIVLVTLNYRVNIDGFLKLKGAASNLGLRDMLFGLTWVQRNIAAFGGDPANVTVFGQSAGATHITSLISSPKAKGLFKRAILQSPSAVAQWDSPEKADAVAARIAAHYGISPTRDAFCALPRERMPEFRTLAGKLSRDPEWHQFTRGNVSLFKPYVDNDILPAKPADAILAGAANNIEVLMGSTREEWRHYIVPNGAISRMDRRPSEQIARTLGLPSSTPDQYKNHFNLETEGDVFARMQSDLIFRMPCNLVLENLVKAGNRRVWAYSFDWRSPVKGTSGAVRGAAHSCDVPFVFETLSAPNAIASNGPDAPQALSRAMHAAWVVFAKGSGAPWQRFDLETRITMCFSEDSKTVSDPWRFERQILTGF